MLPPIHVIDFEGNRRRGILEYGLVTFENGKILEVQQACCRQKNLKTTKHFLDHSRFPEKKKNDEKEFSEHLPLFETKRATGFFCAHNAVVEDRLLRQYRQFPEHSSQKIWGPWIDTYVLSQRFFPEFLDYSVQALIEAFHLQNALKVAAEEFLSKEQNATYHQAGYDALATTLILKFLVENFSIHDVKFLL